MLYDGTVLSGIPQLNFSVSLWVSSSLPAICLLSCSLTVVRVHVRQIESKLHSSCEQIHFIFFSPEFFFKMSTTTVSGNLLYNKKKQNSYAMPVFLETNYFIPLRVIDINITQTNIKLIQSKANVLEGSEVGHEFLDELFLIACFM